jgi:ABC-2 type transport system ATP-binding protein
VIRLTGVSVRRGDRWALADVDVEIPDGLVVGVIGPSGGGKSTLMRTIVGVQANVEGTVEVLGRPAAEAAREGLVGYATQDVAVYDDLTVVENLRYFSRLLGVGGARVEQLIGSLALEDVAARRVADLSGGQRARVSLGIALAADPPVLVLDEPTVGLDPVLRHELWRLFSQLAADGATLLVSSHVMDEAERCDWLLLLHEGHVLAAGTRHELLSLTGAPSIEDAFLALVQEAPG